MNAQAAAFVGALMLIGFAARAGTDAVQLAAPCASCHRTDGENSFIPTLSGMDKTHFLQRMAEFRRQTQGDQIMHVVANALTSQETAAIAQFFAGRPALPEHP